jgi:8-hydroxy-5-deazaflavin:NADPH oxidoreductase
MENQDMRIAIIGTGNMGTGLAQALHAEGLDVVIGHRDPAKASALAEKLGTGIEGGGIAAAVKLADIVVLALPYGAIAHVLSEAGDLTGKTLVDISNPITPDFKDLLVGHTTSAAEEIQKAAPGAHIVKAFNTIFAGLLDKDARKNRMVQVFVAGDDGEATATVRTLAEKLGFQAIASGPLANSRFLEPVGEMNIHFGYFLGHGTATAPAWLAA